MLTIIIRTALIYFFLVFVMRIMGKRQIGQMQISELVISLMLSELAVMPIANYNIPILHSLIPIILLIFLEIVSAYLSTKSRKFKKIFDGTPSIIIAHGKIDQKELGKMRLSLDELLGELRLKEVRGIRDVDYALLEQNGQLSVITAGDSVVGLDHPLIVDGQINKNGLMFIQKSESWLARELKKRHLPLERVFFFSLDDGGNFTVIEKESK